MKDETEGQAARELFEHRHDEGEWSDEPVEIETRAVRSEVVSFRLPSHELTALELSARATGETLSGFIRTAVTEQIRRLGAAQVAVTISADYRGQQVPWGAVVELGRSFETVVWTDSVKFVDTPPVQGALLPLKY